MFGTTDVEALNKIPIDEFIRKFVEGLEQIPNAAGGAKMAMEQFGDTMKFASASIGEIIDKSFNISGAIGKLGDMVDNLVDHLRALSPEAQRSLLSIGALAIAIPAVTTAIGGLIRLLPLLVTGFGLLSGTVGAVVAAVAVGSAAIITNWDKVKTFLQQSGFWQNLVDIRKAALNLVVEVVKLGLNLIQGDWENFGNALQNILKNAWNWIISIFSGGLKLLNNLLASFLNTISGASLVKSLGLTPLFEFDTKASNSALDALVEKLKFNVPDATQKVTESFKGWGDQVKKVLTGEGGSGSNGGLQGVNEELEKMTRLQFELWKIELASKHLKEAEAVKRATEEYKRLAGAIAGVKAESILNPNTDQSIFAQTQRDMRMKGPGVQVPKNLSKDLYSTLIDADFNPAAIAKMISIIPQKLGESLEGYKGRLREWKDASLEAGLAITAAFRQAANESLEAMGELIGNLMTGTAGLENFALKLGGVLANLLKSLGRTLISFGTAGIAMKQFMKNPYTAIIAGVGLIALSTALNNKVQEQMKSTANVKLAKGGAVYGETLAVVGDNRNARFDPELVAPASHVRKYIHDAISEVGGGRSVRLEGEFKIKGEDLSLALERTNRRKKSFGGRY